MNELQNKFALINDPQYLNYMKHKLSDVLTLEEHKWPGRRSVFAIERTVEVCGSRSKEVSYYISSLDADPQKLMQIAQAHW